MALNGAMCVHPMRVWGAPYWSFSGKCCDFTRLLILKVSVGVDFIDSLMFVCIHRM